MHCVAVLIMCSHTRTLDASGIFMHLEKVVLFASQPGFTVISGRLALAEYMYILVHASRKSDFPR